MSLRRSLRVLSPCDLDFDEMRPEGARRRFCESCEKSVHELRTREDAERALAVVNAGHSICVRYPVDARGEPALPRRRRRLMAVPMAILAMGLGAATACMPEGGRAPNQIWATHCVYDSPIYQFELERGEGNCPAAEPEVDEVEIHYDDPVVPYAEIGTPTPKEPESFTVTTVTMGVISPAGGDSVWGSVEDVDPEIQALLEPPEPQSNVRLGKMTIHDES